MTDVRLVLLGSGAVRPNPHRAGPSQALLIDDHILMFDCGPGATRALAAAGLKPENVNRLFLTHLHFDHCGDCPYFILVGWNNGREKPLQIFGPRHTSDFAVRSVRHSFDVDIATRLGHGKDPFGLDPEVTEITNAGTFLSEDAYTVSAIPTEHADMDNLVFRVEVAGAAVVITGDTNPSPQLTQFCRDADLLVCECSGTSEFLAQHPWGKWHMTPETVNALAKEASVKRVLLKHFVIEDITGDREAAERMARRAGEGFAGEVLAGFDGLEIPLPSG